MATRRSGDAVVRITYDESGDKYLCSVKENYSGRGRRVTVQPPASTRLARDSKQAYDDVARAAIAFAMDEDPHFSPMLEHDNNGQIRFGKGYD